MAFLDSPLPYYQRLIRALEIFSEYEPNGHVSAEHDVIYAGPASEAVSSEHLAELESLGWATDEDGGFYHFT